MTNFGIQTNRVDSDQTAPREAVWSASTLFATEMFKMDLQMMQQTIFSRDWAAEELIYISDLTEGTNVTFTKCAWKTISFKFSS